MIRQLAILTFFTIPLAVMGQTTVRVPTIAIAPDTIYSLEEIIYIEGSAPPAADVRVRLEQPGEKPLEFTTRANPNGEWAVREQAFLAEGTWEIRARAMVNGQESGWSDPRRVRSVVTGVRVGGSAVSFGNAALFLIALLAALAAFFAYLFMRVRARERGILVEKQENHIRKLEAALATEEAENAESKRSLGTIERVVGAGFERVKHQLLEELKTLEERAGRTPLSVEDLKHRERILEQLNEIADSIEARIHEAQHND